MKRMLWLVPLMFLWGCSSQKEAERTGRAREFAEELRKYEASFRPSDYDADIEPLLKDTEKSATKVESSPSDVSATKTRELVSGFRVQLFSTTNIDEANSQKAVVESLFPGEKFYIVYDPPTYKIRGGNFLNRFDADRFAQLLVEKGYRDAWIVPDRVYSEVPAPGPAGDQTIQK